MERKTISMEAVKLALDNIEEVGLDKKEVLADSITWLYDRYYETKNRKYLEQALRNMQAYVQLGYPYEKEQELFDGILGLLGIERIQVMFLDERYTKTVKLNKNQVRGMIGKWNPHIHSMTINSVVEDVMDKVRYEKEGIYSYRSGQRILRGKEIPKDEYRLIIYGKKAQFFDIGQGLYYTIEK